MLFTTLTLNRGTIKFTVTTHEMLALLDCLEKEEENLSELMFLKKEKQMKILALLLVN